MKLIILTLVLALSACAKDKGKDRDDHPGKGHAYGHDKDRGGYELPTSEVPEPGTFLMMLTGIVAVGGYKWAKRKVVR